MKLQNTWPRSMKRSFSQCRICVCLHGAVWVWKFWRSQVTEVIDISLCCFWWRPLKIYLHIVFFFMGNIIEYAMYVSCLTQFRYIFLLSHFLKLYIFFILPNGFLGCWSVLIKCLNQPLALRNQDWQVCLCCRRGREVSESDERGMYQIVSSFY